MYWVSTFTAASFASYLNTWKYRFLCQGYAGCHKRAAGCCSGKIIFAFQANLLPLLIPSGLSEMMQRPQTFHEQLTVAFHPRFLMSDNELHGTFNVSIPKAHTNSQSLRDFMSNLDCYEFSSVWLFYFCLSKVKKNQKTKKSKAQAKTVSCIQDSTATACHLLYYFSKWRLPSISKQ